MTEHRPENPFREAGVAFLVGVREIIAAGGRRGTERHQQTAVQTQPVADVVETDGVGELGVDQAHQMAPRAEGACLLVHAGFSREFRHHVAGNEIANLPEHGKLAAAWCGCFIHPLPSGRARRSRQAFFLTLFLVRFQAVLPRSVRHWSLTTLREKLIKIGAKVVRHSRQVIFQMAEVAVPRELFRDILRAIERLRRPAVASG